ncbi:hypothetical protein A9Q86_11720 [Flavobacteriales bacterium 33_180_T64]|nr:hypothetical protein A9Q86_11720 [Flavobacteriales bacterium 33_180_T64]
MHLSPQHLQDLYLAYCNTHLLWKGAVIFNFKQLDIPLTSHPIFLRKLERKLRLGQLAEQFVFNQIETCEAIKLLAENIQIQKDKQTLGELDALITINKQPIHLEIVYKFYLYNPTIGDSEIEKWIGPNRKDSLVEKLSKLKDRQLPLLYSSESQSTLKKFEFKSLNFEQRVLFKAQLFIPYQKTIVFTVLNKECICGFYITIKQLEYFKYCQFYIPTKLDWFLKPHNIVEWLDYNSFKKESLVYLDNAQSPLFWLKDEDKNLAKVFLVWW